MNSGIFVTTSSRDGVMIGSVPSPVSGKLELDVVR